VRTRRFRIIFVTLLLAEAVACAVFVASRPAIGPDGWEFLERQRPKSNTDGSTTFTVVADALNFAIFRRPLGGWESTYGHLFQLLNVFPCLASFITFGILQTLPLTSSRLNSDIATLVFCAVAVVQFTAVATIFSIKRRKQVAAV
jgi:hypothetical protein